MQSNVLVLMLIDMIKVDHNRKFAYNKFTMGEPTIMVNLPRTYIPRLVPN